jgi:hypothetical protein
MSKRPYRGFDDEHYIKNHDRNFAANKIGVLIFITVLLLIIAKILFSRSGLFIERFL